MSSTTVEQIKDATTVAMKKSDSAAKELTTANTEAVTKGGNTAIDGFQQLATAYREVAEKNVETLKTSMQAFAAAKTPAEFIELQQKFCIDSIQTMVSDCAGIAKLTTDLVGASFGPIMKQMEMFQTKAASGYPASLMPKVETTKGPSAR